MFALIKGWLKKRALKKEFTQEIIELCTLDCWRLVEEEYQGKNFETVMKNIEANYLQKGLSQEDIDEVLKKGKNRPIRLE